MTKKALIALLLSGLFYSPGICAEVYSVRHSVSPEKIRLVLEADSPVAFDVSKSGKSVSVFLQSASFKDNIRKYDILDGMVESADISKEKGGSRITVRTAYPVENKIFGLSSPDRVVIDLFRPLPAASQDSGAEAPAAVIQKAEISSAPPPEAEVSSVENISSGVTLYRTGRYLGKDLVLVYGLLVDPKKADVTPAISVPSIKSSGGSSFFAPVLSFFGFSEDRPDKFSHFSKKTVAGFARATNAVAAVNGSFFYGSGTPVGALIVQKQVISSPLYNRTALLIDDDGSCRIDQLKMEGYLKLNNGKTLSFNGVNQPLKKDQIMVYTPDYQATDPSVDSTNVIVSDGSVEGVTYGETKVPRNGFIISALGVAGETIKEYLKKGAPVNWFFLTSPPLDNILHALAAGPQLVYKGKPYISSKEERFRSDVAKSRAARTAVGITERGELLFVVVEGGGGKGATLNELSKIMIDLGAKEAMNLDGGGSSAMVVKGALLNKGGTRPVSNAIVIRSRSL